MTLMTSRLISIDYECNVKLVLLLCLLLISLSTQAESVIDEQIRQLETSLLRIHQNQQNIFQQFQMKQELRHYELRQEDGITSLPQIETYPQTGTATMSEFLPGIVMGGSPPSYEEMVKNKQERQKRIRQYTSDMDQLYTQYLELESEKKILMEQIGDLKRSKQEDIQ